MPVRIEQGRALAGFRKNLPRSACGIFPESPAQSGTGRYGRQEIKYRLGKPQMSNSKNECYEQTQLHTDGKIPGDSSRERITVHECRDQPYPHIQGRQETF